VGWLDFTERPLWIVLAVFTAAAVVVWIAGTRVTQWADTLARVTGIGHAIIGLLLLAGITSLPEAAVSISSAVAGRPAMGVNNLLGGVALQIALLAVADAVFGRSALTVIAGSTVTLLQIAMNVLLLAAVGVAVTVGDRPFLGAGFWTWGLGILYGLSTWAISRSVDRQAWAARKTDEQLARERKDAEDRRERQDARDAAGSPPPPLSVAALAWRLALGALAILCAGFVLSRTGAAVAQQTGLGQSFTGAVLLAVSTSLPDLSAMVAAARLRNLEMAISDIFGTTLVNIGLLLLVDLAWSGPPVINELGPFSLVAALLGAMLAAIYLIGLIERRDRTIARMGIDSVAALAVYLGGLALLYRLR
jgi:cation:H+ antiporter